MKTFLILLSFWIVTTAVAAFAQDEGFQPATVIAFERVANDAQHPEKNDSYKISMRLGEIIYNCHANAPVNVFNDWTINKQFPARVSANGKILQVKNFDGQIIEMNIVGKKKPK